jgi:hypothetical protein
MSIAHRTSAGSRRSRRLAAGTACRAWLSASEPTTQHVGRPRQANTVTGRSTSEIGPTTATSTIARIAAVRPTAPLKRCSRTEPLASGERCSPPDSGVTVHSVVIAPLDTRRGCARITRCQVGPAQASASVRVPTFTETSVCDLGGGTEVRLRESSAGIWPVLIICPRSDFVTGRPSAASILRNPRFARRACCSLAPSVLGRAVMRLGITAAAPL